MKKSVLKDKKVGIVLALLFYAGLFAFLYQAASKINYTWKWGMIPKYFFYKQKEPIVTSPCDGSIIIKSKKVILQCEDGKKIYF
jgi:polar amino acid transport system permease protein